MPGDCPFAGPTANHRFPGGERRREPSCSGLQDISGNLPAPARIPFAFAPARRFGRDDGNHVLQTTRSRGRIMMGLTSRLKVVEIEGVSQLDLERPCLE